MNSNRPFKKGDTLYGGSVPSSGANYAMVGQEYLHNDSSTGRPQVLRAVKNASGITLYGRLPVQLNPAGTEITGYARTTEEEYVILDDDLGSSGVAANDVCYVVTKGDPLVKTAPSGLLEIAAGGRLVAHTQANSTVAGTTAAGVNLLAATTSVPLNRAVMAKAISAATTNNTNTAIRVRIDARLV